RAGVLRLERARERRHGLHVRALQQLPLTPLELEEVPKVPCVQKQLLLRAAPALLRRAEGNAVETAGETLRNREQLERAERLPHERVGAGAFRSGARSPARARQQNDRDIARRGIRLELCAQLETCC